MKTVHVWTFELHYLSPLPGNPMTAPGSWVLVGEWGRNQVADFFEELATETEWSLFREQLRLAAQLMRAYPDEILSPEIQWQGAGADHDWKPWNQFQMGSGEWGPATGTVLWKKKPLILNIHREAGFTL